MNKVAQACEKSVQSILHGSAYDPEDPLFNHVCIFLSSLVGMKPIVFLLFVQHSLLIQVKGRNWEDIFVDIKSEQHPTLENLNLVTQEDIRALEQFDNPELTYPVNMQRNHLPRYKALQYLTRWAMQSLIGIR
jgi:hypothetical protein